MTKVAFLGNFAAAAIPQAVEDYQAANPDFSVFLTHIVPDGTGTYAVWLSGQQI